MLPTDNIATAKSEPVLRLNLSLRIISYAPIVMHEHAYFIGAFTPET